MFAKNGFQKENTIKSLSAANQVAGNNALKGRPAVVQPFSSLIVQRSAFLELATGKKEGFYTRLDILEYLFNEKDPVKQDKAIEDWNNENKKNKIDPNIIIPTDVHHDPAHQFLPPNYHKKIKGKTTEERWSEESFDPDSQEPAFYYSEKNKTAVREQLKQEEASRHRTRKADFSKGPSDKGEQFPCNSCLMPTDDSKLQVDHAQAASDLMRKQKLILQHLNTDKDYRKIVFKKFPDADLYFIDENEDPHDPHFVGSKLFYQRFYNHLENLWFLCADCNGLTGKSGKETLDWLKGIKWFGEPFIHSLGPINHRGILARTINGKSLAAVALEWAIKKGSNELAKEMVFKQYHEHFQKDLRERTELKVQEEHGTSDVIKKTATKKGGDLDNKLEAHVSLIKFASSATVEGLESGVRAMDKAELERIPQYLEGFNNPLVASTYPQGTPTRRDNAYRHGQSKREKKDKKERLEKLETDAPKIAKSLKEKESEVQDLNSKVVLLDSDVGSLKKELEQRDLLIAQLQQKIKELSGVQSPVLTTTTTHSKQPTISISSGTPSASKSMDRIKMEQEIDVIMGGNLGKVGTLRILRERCFESAIGTNPKWSGTQKKQNAIVACVLIYLRKISNASELLYSGKGLEEVNQYDAEDFLPK